MHTVDSPDVISVFVYEWFFFSSPTNKPTPLSGLFSMKHSSWSWMTSRPTFALEKMGLSFNAQVPSAHICVSLSSSVCLWRLVKRSEGTSERVQRSAQALGSATAAQTSSSSQITGVIFSKSLIFPTQVSAFCSHFTESTPKEKHVLQQ